MWSDNASLAQGIAKLIKIATRFSISKRRNRDAGTKVGQREAMQRARATLVFMNNSFNVVDINPQISSIQHYLSVR